MRIAHEKLSGLFLERNGGSIRWRVMMSIVLPFTLAAFLSSPRQIWVDARPANIELAGKNKLLQTVRQALTRNEGEPVLDVDVSFNRLGDDAAVFVVETLVSRLKLKAHEEQEPQSESESPPLSISLDLAMNKITPSGAFGIFEALTEREGESPLAQATNDTSKLSTNNATGASINETSDTANNTEMSTMPAGMVEELDLSFNDIGGHGSHAVNRQLLDSARKLFEGQGTAFVPRILSLENCGLGPAFCRSIGRVSM